MTFIGQKAIIDSFMEHIKIIPLAMPMLLQDLKVQERKHWPVTLPK